MPKNGYFLPAGSQISCFSPSNLTAQQSGYVDAACWDSLLHHGRGGTKSLWALKVWGSGSRPGAPFSGGDGSSAPACGADHNWGWVGWI